MKIVLTGGGTGGHFYPLIAVAEDLRVRIREEHIIQAKLYYAGTKPYDTEALFENDITFIKVSAGKIRRYFSFLTLVDMFNVFIGFFQALWFLFRTYPDVIFSKGGYASVPVVLAGALLRIPIIMHESDAKPGRASLLTARFARYIAVSFPEVASLFPKNVQSKIALTGTPIRFSLRVLSAEGIEELEHYDSSLPLVLILGGSQGSQKINEAIVEALPLILPKAQVIHQTGEKNVEFVQSLSKVILGNSPLMSRYHLFPYLSPLTLKKAAARANVIVTRAGMASISEIAMWKKPAIIIPIPETISHDQVTNAYTYAKTGGAVVIEESNLSSGILANEVTRIALDENLQKTMGEKGHTFAKEDAGRTIADAIITIVKEHNEE